MVFLKSSDKMYNQQHLSLHSIDTYFEPFLNSVLSKDRLGKITLSLMIIVH